MVKIALLADGASIHTTRWANALAARGHDVDLLSMDFDDDALDSRVRRHRLPIPRPYGYIANAPLLRRWLRRQKPDLLHAHYATGYGTLGRLARFRPSLLSVWGADVFEFPDQGRLRRQLLLGNLRYYDRVASTSHVMADRVVALAPDLARPTVTPFGVDLVRFHPPEQNRPAGELVIGTVKTLARKYGIDILIRGMARLYRDLSVAEPDIASRLRLYIVGGGPERHALERLARDEGIADRTVFRGQVPHPEVPNELAKLDIYVAASREDGESFGVAVVEASATGLPVVVSDAGGLPEVVEEGTTGFVVPRNDPEALAKALRTLVADPQLRRRMGAAGRLRAEREYDWNRNVDTMEQLYLDIISQTGRNTEREHAV